MNKLAKLAGEQRNKIAERIRKRTTKQTDDGPLAGLSNL